MKRALKWVGIALAVVLVVALGTYGWAVSERNSILSRELTAHAVDIAVPFPLTDAELEELREERLAEIRREAGDGEDPIDEENEDGKGDDEGGDRALAEPPELPDPLDGIDLDALALERAIARGQHLVEARYACIECHGRDFSGGVMVDDPAFGVILGPNLTAGEGGVVASYTMADWDRTVRHGILPSGRPSAMPAVDFQLMSDQELSDIVAYLGTIAPVDNTVPRPELGPIGTMLMATGELRLSCDLIESHDADHALLPPRAEPTPEFGRHLAGICTGCHGQRLSGGPIAEGPPDWLPAANLTPHADGIAGWQYEDFATAMREMRRPDGSEIRAPMTLIEPYAAQMTNVEIQALWAYLQTLEATPTGGD